MMMDEEDREQDHRDRDAAEWARELRVNLRNDVQGYACYNLVRSGVTRGRALIVYCQALQGMFDSLLAGLRERAERAGLNLPPYELGTCPLRELPSISEPDPDTIEPAKRWLGVARGSIELMRRSLLDMMRMGIGEPPLVIKLSDCPDFVGRSVK